jgi:hypothetical protein
MRIRSLKPEFWSSFSVAKLSEPALILAIGLLNHSCDAGYFEADPRIIKAAIFPLREPSRSIPGCLSELVGIGYIEVREAHDGRLVGHVVKFGVHQVINKPGKTVSKACRDYSNGRECQLFTQLEGTQALHLSGSPTGILPEPSEKKPAGTGNREQGKGAGISSCPNSAPPDSDEVKGEASEKKNPSEEGSRFVDWFLRLLVETESPEPKLTPAIRAIWATCYDRMIRIDGRTKEQVKEVCRWARSDSFWRSNFLSPVKLRDKKDGVMYFDLFLSRMQPRGTGTASAVRPATLWELQQREKAVRDRIRAFQEGHKGMEYVGMLPGRTSPWEWTEAGKAELQQMQNDLAEIQRQIASAPESSRQSA